MLVTEKRTREDFQKAGCSVREERIYIPEEEYGYHHSPVKYVPYSELCPGAAAEAGRPGPADG